MGTTTTIRTCAGTILISGLYLHQVVEKHRNIKGYKYTSCNNVLFLCKTAYAFLTSDQSMI